MKFGMLVFKGPNSIRSDILVGVPMNVIILYMHGFVYFQNFHKFHRQLQKHLNGFQTLRMKRFTIKKSCCAENITRMKCVCTTLFNY